MVYNKVKREGRSPVKRILLVCTGNTCRSPMAEALFRRMAEKKGVPVEVASAGVAALAGQPMSKHAADVLKDRGIPVGTFRSKEVDAGLVSWADLILTMTAQHKRRLLELYPQAVDKTYALKEFADGGPETAALHREREALIADMQLKLALKQPIGDAERNRLYELERRLPSVDIIDPIGQSRKVYEATADDIEAAADVILERWKNER